MLIDVPLHPYQAQMETLDKTISEMKGSLDRLLSEEKKAKIELASIKNEPSDGDLDM